MKPSASGKKKKKTNKSVAMPSLDYKIVLQSLLFPILIAIFSYYFGFSVKSQEVKNSIFPLSKTMIDTVVQDNNIEKTLYLDKVLYLLDRENFLVSSKIFVSQVYSELVYDYYMNKIEAMDSFDCRDRKQLNTIISNFRKIDSQAGNCLKMDYEQNRRFYIILDMSHNKPFNAMTKDTKLDETKKILSKLSVIKNDLCPISSMPKEYLEKLLNQAGQMEIDSQFLYTEDAPNNKNYYRSLKNTFTLQDALVLTAAINRTIKKQNSSLATAWIASDAEFPAIKYQPLVFKEQSKYTVCNNMYNYERRNKSRQKIVY